MAMSATGFNSGVLEGSGWVPGTINPANAQRSSSQTSFWEQTSHTSMKVYTRTRAKRILFDQNTANGVEVATENWTYHLHARKEVVLSAGAFNSPSLLM